MNAPAVTDQVAGEKPTCRYRLAIEMKGPIKPKQSAGLLATATFRRRPMTSAISRSGMLSLAKFYPALNAFEISNLQEDETEAARTRPPKCYIVLGDGHACRSRNCAAVCRAAWNRSRLGSRTGGLFRESFCFWRGRHLAWDAAECNPHRFSVNARQRVRGPFVGRK